MSKLNRRVLFRPKRSNYVRGIKNSKTRCVFCEAAKNKPSFKTLCVFKSEHSMVILNKFPYNSGHLLVLPQRHEGNLFELSQEEYLDLNETLKLASQAITKIYEPAGFNIGLNHGRAAGAGLPDHLHFHVIPRWEGDLNFFPLVTDTKVVIEDLKQSYKKLSQYFRGHK
jgi:ATP adenylyltransferase